MRWIDTHTHIYDAAFLNDYADMVDRAEQAGVSDLFVIAEDVAVSRKIIELVKADDRLHAVVGIHPGEVDAWGEGDLGMIREFLDRAPELKIRGVGEIGLDYHYTTHNRAAQIELFRAQMSLAYEFDLPAVIHNRDAHQDSLTVVLELAAEGRLCPSPGVFHCYSGSPELARELLKLGFYFGFDGPITYKNAKRSLRVLEGLPRDVVVLETDCPYLPPVPYRGKRNEPSYLPLIGAKLAEIWGVTEQEAARLTTENARRLFRI